MIIKTLSFHEICEIIREKPSSHEVNHIINQMIPNVWFEDYDEVCRNNHTKMLKNHSNRISIRDKLYL